MILRSRLRSGVRNTSFASCWLIVLPPWTTRPAWMLRTNARPMPIGSMPGVLIEAPVLDRDHRLGQPGRDLIEREVLAVAIAEAREGDAGAILQRDLGLPVVQGNAPEVGEVEAEVPPEADDQQEQARAGRTAVGAAAGRARRCCLFASLGSVGGWVRLATVANLLDASRPAG